MPMLEIHQLTIILALFAVHLIVPGPNMLFLATSVSRGGRREALLFALGTSVGTSLWAAGAAMGALHVLNSQPVLLNAMALSLGAALIVLSGRSLLTAIRLSADRDRDVPARSRPFWRGVVVTIGNVNELIFWGMVMTLMAKMDAGADFGISLAIGTGVIAFIFDASLAAVASGKLLGDVLIRYRRALEFLMGATLGTTGAALLMIVAV